MSCGFLSQALRWQLDFSLFTFRSSLNLLYPSPPDQQPKGGEARKKNYAGVLGRFFYIEKKLRHGLLLMTRQK